MEAILKSGLGMAVVNFALINFNFMGRNSPLNVPANVTVICLLSC